MILEEIGKPFCVLFDQRGGLDQDVGDELLELIGAVAAEAFADHDQSLVDEQRIAFATH